MTSNHGVKNRTGPPSTPRHTACKVARADSCNCSEEYGFMQQNNKHALSDKALDASSQAVGFVPWYKVGRLLFAFPFSVGNRGPPISKFTYCKF